MRLIRVAPGGPLEIQDACLQDLDALLPGASVLARCVATPGQGTIDLLAVEREGRLALVSFHLRAGSGEVAEALARWDWLCANLPALRALGEIPRADLTADPRLILVASRATDGARRLAGRITRPSIHLLRAALMRTPAGVGLLIEPVAAIHPAAHPGAGVDPLLGGLPPGASRSLVRRLVEQLKGEGHSFAAIEGGVDVERDGRLIGSVLATPGGVEARRAGEVRSMRVDTDEDCREAARFLMAPAMVPHTAATPRRSVAASLLPEEIHELESPGPRVAPRPLSQDPPPHAEVEN